MLSSEAMMVVSQAGTTFRDINESRTDYPDGLDQTIGQTTSRREIDAKAPVQEQKKLKDPNMDSQRVLVVERMEVAANLDLNENDVTLSFRERSKDGVKSRDDQRYRSDKMKDVDQMRET